ncbi:MAG: bifunctional UDP-N-acetylglucosamine diphosphorylase/glucosamine-1-phosphate N-acetyltransferase GlmU, partial [Halobacteriovoraceae bacterium]|nr:bifunctional UDP-N-acetylglucosamine diphosphorylase/glucosamine-1-phosphate N-acetyltransferase GlmU [Halobacteriovoraceae bacterium]
MSDQVGSVILAAGEGTRLKMSCPKPLAPASGRTLIDFPVLACKAFCSNCKIEEQINVIIGHEKEKVAGHLEKFHKNIKSIVQDEQLGTGHALKCYFEQNDQAKKMDYTVVLCGDTPLISATEIEKMYRYLKDNKLDGVAASFTVAGEHQYGRIVRSQENQAFKIVEHKDADQETRKIAEVNSAFYVFKTAFVIEHLYNIKSDNAAGEFYLTDLFKEEYRVEALLFDDPKLFHGVNDLYQLQKAETFLMSQKIKELAESGVRFTDPSHTYVDDEVSIGAGTTVYPNVFLQGKTTIGKDCTIEPGAILINSTIEDGATVRAYSHLEEAILRTEAVVGPFARLRTGSDVGARSKIGNFVELKKAVLKEEVKASHLAYIGDAEIGARSNISCGVITCNYDGA